MDFSDQIKTLTKIGAALTSEHDINELMELIVREARSIANADGGSLYIKEDNQLQFMVSQNETMIQRYRDRSLLMDKFKPFPVALSNESLSGYAANNAETINIADVRNIPADRPYSWNPSYDEKNDYKTVSMLSAPMVNRDDEVIGVLQLINARVEDGEQVKVIPFDDTMVKMVESIASQAAVSITNARLNAKIKEAYLDTIYRLSVAAEYKDHDTASHIMRMSLYSQSIARSMGMDKNKVEMALYSSPMHDVGKLGVPDAILLKPGPLTPEERKVMEAHTTYGGKILKGSDSEVLEISRIIAESHHEKWDGTGYPKGLAGEEIPLMGRIVSLADVFDALTTQRPYKRAWPVEKALDIIKRDAGKHFDPGVVDGFYRCLDEVMEIYMENQDESGEESKLAI